MGSPVQVVRELWEAHAAGGIDAFLEAAGEDVVWQPHIAGGRIFRSTAALRQAIAAMEAQGIRYEAVLHGLEQHGDVVLASGALRVHRDGSVEETEVHWAYHFREGRLWRQTTHATRQDALDALAALRAIQPFGVAEEDAGDGLRVVRLHGELDIATAPELEATLLRPRQRGERLVVDLGDLQFLDSTGLRVLLRAQAAAKEGGWELYLRNVPANIRRLFELAGVEDVVPPEPPPDVSG